jgi:hypothetical protein
MSLMLRFIIFALNPLIVIKSKNERLEIITFNTVLMS